ncbi:MAG TPA: CDP-alcohol phosphatidyltransferase family protein [Anaerolineales bacterium]|nr:CDP-alcohol phosphatidyltransferase family protein [Anaerolineales bacterium]
MDIDHRADVARPTLSDLMRLWFRWILDPAGTFLLRLGLVPNTMTLAGLAGNFIAALYLASGNFLVGGILVLAMGPIDALDGTMARLRGEASEWGAFVDSVSDRYSELFILGGLIVHYLMTGDRVGAGLAFGAAAGSVLVSYAKARAESLGFEARGGILTRFERYLVLVPALLLGFVHVGLGVITVLANLTALQRIWMVRRQARRR